MTTSQAAAIGFAWAANLLSSHGMQIVHERIFGSLGVERVVIEERAAAFRGRGIPLDGPVTYIQGHPPWGEGLAGWIIHAVPRTSLDYEPCVITDRGVPVGRSWHANGVGSCMLQNLHAAPQAGESSSRAMPVRHTIEMAARLLHEQGLDYLSVVRTWFYLDGILDWYDEFNRARDEAHGALGLGPDSRDHYPGFPASTGVGGRTADGGACTLDLLAIGSSGGADARVRFLSNPMQGEPASYGSAFSRGAVVDLPRGALIHVSGTAAIDREGRSLFPGDARAQIEHTLDAIEALLAPEGAHLNDIAAATAFVKRPADAETFQAALASRDLLELPVVCMVADICRDELLFEMDAEVALERPTAAGLSQAGAQRPG